MSIIFKPKVLTQVLAQANTDNVLSTIRHIMPKDTMRRQETLDWLQNCREEETGGRDIEKNVVRRRSVTHRGSESCCKKELMDRLLNSEGGLLAYTGYDNKDARVTAAIANNIWSAFDRNARTAFDNDHLQMVVLECESGNVVIARVANFLLCTYSHQKVCVGMLRAKAQALVDFLEEPLRKVMVSE